MMRDRQPVPRKHANFQRGISSNLNPIGFPIDHPAIPFRKRFTPAQVNSYLFAKCSKLISLDCPFEGERLRINPCSGEGVMLDYIGCCLYDSIMTCNKKLCELEEVPNSQREFVKLRRRFEQLRAILAGSYREAFSVLVR